MKSILISILPQWVEKICHKIGEIDGKPIYEKEIEIRKDKPMQVQVPFKCFIYETYDKKYDGIGVCWEKGNTFEHACKKVIGEFICDRIIEYDYNSLLETYTTKMPITNFTQTCLNYTEINSYGKGRHLYGWHISDLKIYDKPKGLNSFKSVSKYTVEKVVGSDGTPCVLVNERYLIYLNGGCVYDTISAKDIPKYVFNIRDEVMSNNEYCLNRSVVRAPQSWCYVEE